jgi:hypothetical protein
MRWSYITRLFRIIHKFSSYFTWNTLRLRYKTRPVNAA